MPKLDLAMSLLIFLESPVVMWMLPWGTRPNAGRAVMSVDCNSTGGYR